MKSKNILDVTQSILKIFLNCQIVYRLNYSGKFQVFYQKAAVWGDSA